MDVERSGSGRAVTPEADDVRPVLILNPRHDESFVALAEAEVDAGAATPDALQARLRERYPRAIVRERGLSSESALVWYVYRDGHWVP